MNKTVKTRDARERVSDEELIGVLTAISVVSKRLAKKLSMFAGRANQWKEEN